MKIKLAKLNFSPHLQDKIFEIRFEADDTVSKIISYFSFSESERQEICSILNNEFFEGFRSIFTDNITEEEWDRTKEQIKKKFRDIVDFGYHNLVSDRVNRRFDIIFCRNVMIYFDDDLKMKVLRSLVEALEPVGGFLVLGYYDMLPEESREFLKQYDANARIYTPYQQMSRVG